MSKICFVASDGLSAFLDSLSQKGLTILAPSERPASSKPTIVFAPWKKGDAICLKKATQPPRGAVLPQAETLFNFRKLRKDCL